MPNSRSGESPNQARGARVSRPIRDFLDMEPQQQRFAFRPPQMVAAEIVVADGVVKQSFERPNGFEPAVRIGVMTDGPTHCFILDRRSALMAYVGLGVALGYLRWPEKR